MKTLLKNIIQKYLTWLAKKKLRRTKPEIIGITGSIGKTSTKEAVAIVLSHHFRTYRNPKSLNTEFGLPLAILEQSSGFSSIRKWLPILWKAFWNALVGAPYEKLVLEYGADRPGNISSLMQLAKPHIVIITKIAPVHLAEGQFRDVNDILQEKKKLVTHLPKSGMAILNGDDPMLSSLPSEIQAKTFFYGTHSQCDMWMEDLKQHAEGVSGNIHYRGKTYEFLFPIMGTYHVSQILLPAILCGVLFGMTVLECIQVLCEFRLPPGRMTAIPGIRGSLLLDSSYNASPETVEKALALLSELPGKRKIAVLGNMNELGNYTEEGHRRIGRLIPIYVDHLVTVGKFAVFIANEALKSGFPQDKIKSLKNSMKAGLYLKKEIREGDVVLLKGSQNRVRLERAIAMLMAHPKDAKKLLPRQEKVWKSIA